MNAGFPPDQMPEQPMPMGAGARARQQAMPPAPPMGGMTPDDLGARPMPQMPQSGAELYGNPVLDSEPFDESMFGDLTSPAAPLGMGPEAGMGLGMADGAMGQDPSQAMPYSPESQNETISSNPSVKADMMALLAQKAQKRQAASQHFQDAAMAQAKQQ